MINRIFFVEIPVISCELGNPKQNFPAQYSAEFPSLQDKREGVFKKNPFCHSLVSTLFS